MWSIQRILVPLDGSTLSERALPVAESLANQYQAEIMLLRVLDLPMPTRVPAHPESLWIQEALQENHREIERYLASQRTALESRGIDIRVVVANAAPAEDILFVAESEAVDLIVMSSHGQGGSIRWGSGSVADKVMQQSPCPVLLIRLDEASVDEQASR